MDNESRKFRVGLLTIVSGSLFLGLLFFVLGKGFTSEREIYYILFEENVKGMLVGSKVNFQGVPFGSVSDIRFEGGRTLVEMSVDPRRAVIQDVTRARLDRLLVTGQVTVELEGYGHDGRQLPPFSYVEPVASPISQLTRSLPEVIDEAVGLVTGLRRTVDRVDAMLAGDFGRGLTSLVTNADRTAALLPERLERFATRMDALLVTTTSAAAAVDAACTAIATTASGPEVQALLAETRTALQRLQDLQGRMDGVMAEAQSMLTGLRAPTTAALQSLRTTLDEARSFLRTMRLAPNSLLYGLDRAAEAAVPGGGR